MKGNKMRKILLILLLLVAFHSHFYPQTFRRSVDFTDRPIGITKSSIYSDIIRTRLSARPISYTTMGEGIIDLRSGKIDGYLIDLSIARMFVSDTNNSDLRVIDIADNAFSTDIGACSHDKVLIERFNIYLKKIQEDGTLDEMQNRWFEANGKVEHPIIRSSGLKGVIKVGTNSRARPFSYLENDKFAGYSIELIQRFAADIEYRIEFTDLLFHDQIPFVRNKKVDMAISNISMTPERKKIVMFSEPIYVGKAGIIVRS